MKYREASGSDSSVQNDDRLVLFAQRPTHIKLILASNIRQLEHCIQRRNRLQEVLVCNAKGAG